ncbi:MAG TPA: TetR/AcrR family transcriptional regulator [Syntrophomonas sp.]|nr:TetR/AcrR family transcriptional regulator [Syntrophomonas sp.]HPT69702.1 TetR/AcrR family transcriptional regulator [Syntrophomonas sp.]
MAARLFREKGYISASLDDITDQIGISKPAVYYYFEAKEDILFEICMTHINRLQNQAKAIAASDLALTEKIARMLSNHMLQFHLQRDSAETYLREAAHLSLERRKFASDTLKLYESFLREHVDQAINQGIFRPVDSKLVLRGIGGMLNWLGNWYTPDGNCDIEYIITTHIDFIMHGLMADPDKDAGRFAYKIEKGNCPEQ